MITHVKVVAILHIVMGGLGILAAIIVFAVMGGVAGLVGMTDHSSDSAVAVPVLGWIGALIFIVLMVLSIPSVIAGVGLLQFRPWARMLTIVLSVLHLFNIPFGTAAGIYSLWALLSPEGEALFRAQRAYPAYPPAYPPA